MRALIQIPERLFRDLEELAACEQTTVAQLVEEELRTAVSNHKRRGDFRLRDASFGEGGLREELRDADEQVIRRLAYGDEP